MQKDYVYYKKDILKDLDKYQLLFNEASEKSKGFLGNLFYSSKKHEYGEKVEEIQKKVIQVDKNIKLQKFAKSGVEKIADNLLHSYQSINYIINFYKKFAIQSNYDYEFFNITTVAVSNRHGYETKQLYPYGDEQEYYNELAEVNSSAVNLLHPEIQSNFDNFKFAYIQKNYHDEISFNILSVYKNKISKTSYPSESIISFSFILENDTETTISGGKVSGGDYSLGKAAVGYAIGGAAGAVILGKNSVKSEGIKVDKTSRKVMVLVIKTTTTEEKLYYYENYSSPILTTTISDINLYKLYKSLLKYFPDKFVENDRINKIPNCYIL